MTSPINRYCVSLLVCFALWTSCQHGHPTTIDFSLTAHNNIAVDALLNQSDTVTLMFHTDINSVSLTPDMCKQLDTQKQVNTASSQSWSGSGDVEYIRDNHLQIADLQWDSLTVWLNLLSGHDTDGKFGPNLFGDQLIEIDFDQSKITLHDPKEVGDLLSNYDAFSLSTDENNSLFIEGKLQIDTIELTHRFMIHSGYSGTIILDDAFYQAHPIISDLDVIEEKELKDSFGNIIKTKKVNCHQINLMNVEFENVPISFFDSPLEIQQTSVLGGGFLKRFNLILDKPNQMLYARPNGLNNEPF